VCLLQMKRERGWYPCADNLCFEQRKSSLLGNGQGNKMLDVKNYRKEKEK
jgi:hypothetical protein